jgi:hypothetical protein
MGKNKNKNKKTDAAVEQPPAETKEDEEMTEKPSEETPNDGVKLLEEVFGSKSSVSSNGVSEDSTSNNSSTELVKEATTEDKQESKEPEGPSVIGPMPPADDEFDEEDLKKAEEHKT